MGIKIKNLQTGEFEKFNIPALKGEKGEPGEIEPSEKVDYIGKQHSKLRDTMNANVDYIIKTAIGEFNYLDYDGQHITATNSIEGHARSAILKGWTLVNLYPNINHEPSKFSVGNSITIDDDNWVHVANHEGAHQTVVYKDISLFKPNTTYTVIVEVKNNTLNSALTLFQDNHKGIIQSSVNIEVGFNGTKKFLVTTVSDFTDKIKVMQTQKWYTTSGEIDYRITIIEGDYTNINIPYFTGMQSVKMPVLTTTGKNLFDGKFKFGEIAGGVDNNDTKFAKSINYIPVKPNTNYFLSCTDGYNSTNGRVIAWYDSNKKFITHINHKGISPINACYARIRTRKDDSSPMTESEVSAIQAQLEEGSNATSYEAHKSNILHTPEEVVLRSLPNGVCDTLNVETGEYVQRIGEITFNGSETWQESGNVAPNHYCAFTRVEGSKNVLSYNIMCNSLPVKNILSPKIDYEGCVFNAWTSGNMANVVVKIANSKLSSASVNGVKAYLQSNPLTVQYELATPIIKTVDLSDNHVYSYKGTTHYSCSSEEGSLVPTLSVKVPTDTQLTIQEQKATTQTLLIKNMDLQQSIKEVQAMNLVFNTALYNSFNSIREEVEDIKKHVSTNENLEGSF